MKVLFRAICLLLISNLFAQKDDGVMLFIGQDMGAVGGFTAPNNNGYVDNVNSDFDGITTYTAFPSLAGLETKTNYGSGDVCGQCHLENKHLDGKHIAIGIYLVDQLEAMNRGELDMQIQILSDWVKNSGRTVFLRIGYEFDGNWNHYDPEQYKLAYKRIVDQLRKDEVTNFVTVWQACTSPVDDIIEQKKENIEDWYPGDDYVDWAGLSWFLCNDMQYELSNEVLDFARVHQKPVMICESTPQGYDLQEKKQKAIVEILDGKSGQVLKSLSPQEIWDAWYLPFFTFIEKNSDVIKSVAYINARWDDQPMWGAPYSQGYWGDSRVEANKKIKAMWLAKWAKLR